MDRVNSNRLLATANYYASEHRPLSFPVHLLAERRASEQLSAQLACLPSAYKPQPPPPKFPKGKGSQPMVPSGASQDLTGVFSGCLSDAELSEGHGKSDTAQENDLTLKDSQGTSTQLFVNL